MTSIEFSTPAIKAAQQTSDRLRWRHLPLWLLIGLALLLGLVLSFHGVRAVWNNGTFSDPDDAMQLVQVRELLSGQPWFDMTIGRLDPPHGVFMHWSRIVDIPLALSIKSFASVLPMWMAERLTRLLFPLVMQALLYWGVARVARTLIGPEAILPALVLTLFSGIMFGEFQPGRIAHIAPQIVILVFMLAAFLEAVDPARARHAAIAGGLAALSLAISIENLPFIAALAALSIGVWIARGADMRAALASFGLGLGIGLPLTFVATIGPSRWLNTACDAYSLTYLMPGIAGAAVMIGLAAATQRLAGGLARLSAAGLGAVVVLCAVVYTKPICFIDPYHGIDPLLRTFWLTNVQEAMSLRRFFAGDHIAALLFLMPIALGFVACLSAACRETGLAQLRWMIVAAMSAVGIAFACWMIRMLGFAGPLALFGGAWCIVRLHERLVDTRWREAAMLSFVLVLPFSPLGWALVLPQNAHVKDHSDRCLASAAFAPLATLPPGLVAGPIDAGSHMLALTSLSVLAGPYHRDNHGNVATIDAFLADPAKARDILRVNKVTYVMTCPGLNETAAFAKRAPHGLAAILNRGDVPPWLQRVPTTSPYQVFVMKH